MRDYTNNIINNNEEWWADGIFSEITLVSVPEPTGIILFFSGLVMLIVRVKKT